VGNGGNFFAFNATGAYTINFGDGTTTNYASNTQANYEYNFNNSALDGTNCPVTFTAATNTVNRTAHGLSNGSIIRFYNIVTTTGILSNANYYVINATANTFQVALTASGSAVAMTNDGSATLLPYKVAIVTITPQAGQNWTVVNLGVKHNQTGLQVYGTGWLDLALSVPNVTGTLLTIGGVLTAHTLVERINIVAVGALTSLASLFRNCRSLQSIPSLPSATAVTIMSSMFEGCASLQTIPPFPGSVAAVTVADRMFSSCASLQTIPPFPGSVAALGNMSNMFASCASLQTIPPFPGSTAAVTTVNSMFANCSSLSAVPAMNQSGITSAANLTAFISACPSLARAPVTGARFSFSVASCKLSAAALNEIFTGLPTVTGQTITVTGNYGISQAGYDPTIATAKGWTVTA
jgi:hypothetical protein